MRSLRSLGFTTTSGKHELIRSRKSRAQERICLKSWNNQADCVHALRCYITDSRTSEARFVDDRVPQAVLSAVPSLY